jgi:hypothetical protein
MSIPIGGDQVAAPGPAPRGNDALLVRLEQFERRLSEQDRKTLYSARISGGRLTISGSGGIQVRDADDDETFFVGGAADPIYNRPDGQPQQVVVAKDDSGQIRMALYDPFPNVDGYTQNFYLWDGFGNVVFVTDNQGGLARPYIPVPFNKVPSAAYPNPTTDWASGASTSFQRVWEANCPKQQPKMNLRILTGVLTAGATAQYRVMVNGVQTDTWSTTNNGLLPVDRDQVIPGDSYASLQIGIECRRSAGAGNIYCHLTDAWGHQS